MNTLTAISVERLLALFLGLRYEHVVTLKRTYVAVITVWALSPSTAVVSFIKCTMTLWSTYVATLLALLIAIVSYTRIFRTLYYRRRRINEQYRLERQGQKSPLKLARYIKAVSSALRVLVALVRCYLPYAAVTALWSILGLESVPLPVTLCKITLGNNNSSLSWKIKEVKRKVQKKIGEILCRGELSVRPNKRAS